MRACEEKLPVDFNVLLTRLRTFNFDIASFSSPPALDTYFVKEYIHIHWS